MNLIAGLFKLFRLLFSGVCEPAVLIYHRITPGVAPGSGLSVQAFEEHLRIIDRLKLKVAPLKQIVSNDHVGDHVFLTFDDGTVDFIDLAWPVIRRFNFSVTLFIVTEKIGQPGYLTSAQLKELSLSGLVSIGSHTVSHRYLPGLTPEDIEFELARSKVSLQDLLGTEVEFLAYPWGGFNAQVKEAAKRSGYLAAFSTNQELKGASKVDGRFCLKRLTVTDHEPFLKFLIKLSGFAVCFSRKL
jgi:peptidoglycan/xylan/chitin deacetylase (PgdA/CDA1 family)